MGARRIAAVAVALAAAGLAAASALSFSTASTPSGHAWPSGCPRHAVSIPPATPADYEHAAQAVHAQLRRVFGDLTSQGHAAWHQPGITALISADGTGYGPGGWPPPFKGTAFYRKTAVRACGRRVARDSLVAFIEFPDCQLACAYTFAYVTKTRRGWYMWTSYRI